MPSEYIPQENQGEDQKEDREYRIGPESRRSLKRIPSRLHAVSTEPKVGLEPMKP